MFSAGEPSFSPMQYSPPPPSFANLQTMTNITKDTAILVLLQMCLLWFFFTDAFKECHNM